MKFYFLCCSIFCFILVDFTMLSFSLILFEFHYILLNRKKFIV